MNYQIEQLDELPIIKCTCGLTRRAFTNNEDQTATVHLLSVQTDAQVHYHKKLTEIYLILEGEGFMELDGDIVPVKPMTSIMIKPGCRHRAVGELKIAIIVIPTFDPDDVWFDD